MATRIFLHQQVRRNSSATRTSVFDLGIRHLLLERGEIYYNNRKSELSADLHDLTLQSSFELLRKSYSGTLSYRDGHLQLQNASPIGHNFEARFVATPEEFRLESADLKTANSRLSLVATVHNYSQPQVHATYNATIDGGEFRRALNNPSLPEGIVVSSGVLDYDARSDRPLVASVNAQGEMHSASVTVTSQNAKIKIRDVGARYSLANGNAAVTGIHGQLLGGSTWGHHHDARPRWRHEIPSFGVITRGLTRRVAERTTERHGVVFFGDQPDRAARLG